MKFLRGLLSRPLCTANLWNWFCQRFMNFPQIHHVIKKSLGNQYLRKSIDTDAYYVFCTVIAT